MPHNHLYKRDTFVSVHEQMLGLALFGVCIYVHGVCIIQNRTMCVSMCVLDVTLVDVCVCECSCIFMCIFVYIQSGIICVSMYVHACARCNPC